MARLLVLLLAAAAVRAQINATAPLTPQPVVETNSSALFGWTRCVSVPYSTGNGVAPADLATLYGRCAGPGMLLGCAFDSDNGTVVRSLGGAADRDEVVFPAGGSAVATASLTRFFANNASVWGLTNTSISAPAACTSATGGAHTLCRQMSLQDYAACGTCFGIYTCSASARFVVYTNAAQGLTVGDNCTSPLLGCCNGSGVVAADGACECPAPVVCPTPDPDGCVASYTCVPEGGTCEPTFKSAGASCQNADLCIIDDQCDGAGTCVNGTTPPAPPLPPPCQFAGSCNSSTGAFDLIPAPDGAFCTSVPCTTDQMCQSGVCTGGTPVTCTPSGACVGSCFCDNGTNSIINVPAAAGTACLPNDNACVTAGECTGVNTTCVPTAFRNCSVPANCLGAGVCAPSSGNCVNRTALPDNTTCSDGDPCTLDDRCQTAVCVPGPEVSCPTNQTCRRAGTPFAANATTCVCEPNLAFDGSLCTVDACLVGTQCISGVCNTSEPPLTCPGDACNDPLGMCNPATGCANPKPDGTPCVDCPACYTNGTCASGTCNCLLDPTCAGAALLWALGCLLT